jgi:hypothetical protein
MQSVALRVALPGSRLSAYCYHLFASEIPISCIEFAGTSGSTDSGNPTD